jgi:hypothetical protein
MGRAGKPRIRTTIHSGEAGEQGGVGHAEVLPVQRSKGPPRTAAGQPGGRARRGSVMFGGLGS